MVRGSGKDATRSRPSGGAPGTSGWQEATGQAEDQVEGLYLHAGLGTPRDPAQSELGGVAGKREVWETLLERLPTSDKRMKTDGRGEAPRRDHFA